MRKLLHLLLVCVILSMILAPASLLAQEEEEESADAGEIICEIDIETIMEEVEQVCTGIGRDQVCYGNVEVNAIPRQAEIDLEFDNPGDSTQVSLIRSLYLSALDAANETWGIAQMRLLANLTQQQPEEVTLLLFGDVSVEDRSEQRVELEIAVNPNSPARIRNTPSLNSLTIDIADPDEIVQAIGRLEDNTWIRIKEDEYGRVGWIYGELLQLDRVDIDSLAVDNFDTPYYGAMQAFYFESGSSPSCGNMISDGLLVQTPEGVARLSLLINEVSIELLGANSGATALLEANADAGMNISMLNGSANVTSGDTTVFVDTNNSVNISLDESLSPDGGISDPSTVDLNSFNEIILLPLIDSIVTALYPDAGGTTTGTAESGGPNHGCIERGNSCNAPGQQQGGGRGSNNNKP